jgi:DNA-directed RNA polymerase specialized sigma24 family protein
MRASRPRSAPRRSSRTQREPLPEKLLRDLRRVALRNLRGVGVEPGTRRYEEAQKDAEEIVNDIHHGYLRGEIPKQYLHRHAKHRAIDRVRSNARRPDRIALDTQATEDETGKIEYVVVAPTDTPPNATDDLNIIAGLMLTAQHRQCHYRGRTFKNPWANENRMIAHLDAQRVRDRMKPSQRTAFTKLGGGGRGRPSYRTKAAAEAALRSMQERGLVGKIGRVLRPVRNPTALQAIPAHEESRRKSESPNE